MSSGTGDELKGKAKQAGGKVEEGLGRASGDTDMQARGEADQTEGKVNEFTGDVKNAASNAADKVKDAIND